MSELLDYYTNQGCERIDFPQVSALKKAAFSDFTRLGFPTRRNEAWKYTSTDQFIKQRFAIIKQPPVSRLDNFPLSSMFAYDMYGRALTDRTLPDGVILLSWADALMQHAEKIAPFLGQILTHRHGFQAQNTAMLQDGVFIYVPAGISLDEPVLLSNGNQRHSEARYFRNLIVLEADSSLRVIEDYHGDEATVYFTNTATEVSLGSNAELIHYKLQREGRLAYHVGELVVRQSEQSRFESHSFSIGGQWVRSDVQIAFSEPHAECLLNGIYVTRETQHLDHHTVIEHKVPLCSSEQDYKGLIMGQSRAVFNGAVVVSQDAQQTVAKQHNKNLLLSSHAEVDTKPQLEIFAHDVVCTHGATVGQLDDDALFYMATRGIAQEDARCFLIHAFVEENLRKMASLPLAAWMSGLINQHVG
jgi:Fe-S cluster assembly protein SufD